MTFLYLCELQHMAVMEQRTTELLQQYAILLMYDPQTAEDDESLHTKARLSSTIAAATGEPSLLGDDATTSPRSSAGRSQLQLGPSCVIFLRATWESLAPVRVIATSADLLVWARLCRAPPGSLACSLASSALLTSLLDDVISAVRFANMLVQSTCPISFVFGFNDQRITVTLHCRLAKKDRTMTFDHSPARR